MEIAAFFNLARSENNPKSEKINVVAIVMKITIRANLRVEKQH